MQGLWNQEVIAESPPTVFSDRFQLQMISFSLDPQWCGLLFSVYCRQEKTGLLGADPFSTSSLPASPLDADWIAFAGSVGFEICRLSSTWALIFETVKASGVILLLGVGSLVCYKLYHYYWPRSRSRLNSPNSTPPHARRPDGCVPFHIMDDNQLVEDLDDEDINSIEGRYFGPCPLPKNNNPQEYFQVSDFLKNSRLFPDREVLSSSHSEGGTSEEDDGRDADISDSSHEENTSFLQKILQQKCNPQFSRERWCQSQPVVGSLGSMDSNWLIKRIGDMLTSPVKEQKMLRCGSTSLPVTPGRNCVCIDSQAGDRSCLSDWSEEWKLVGYTALERQKISQSPSSITRGMLRPTLDTHDVLISPVQGHLHRDESCDSLGFTKALPREGSFDSTCSEMSIDFSLPEPTLNTNTVVYLESLQQEIDQLKNNCLMMDEEFETIKCNRNVPGMSSLMTASIETTNALSVSVDTNHSGVAHETLKQEHARACFAGLYSLTTIKHSTSSDLSDSFIANGRASIESAESLVWDSPKSVASPTKCNNNDISQNTSNISETNVTIPGLYNEILLDNSHVISSEDEIMANLEWDEDDMTKYSTYDGDMNDSSSILASMGLLEMDMEVELSLKEKFESANKNHLVESESAVQNKFSGQDCTVSPITERSSNVKRCGSESKMANSNVNITSSQMLNEWDQDAHPLLTWSSEESGYMEWDGTSLECSMQMSQEQQGWDEVSAVAQSSSSTSEQSTPISENPVLQLASPLSELPTSTISNIKNIGHKVNIIEYAVQEWQGQTKKAQAVLKGYREIPSILGIQHLRRIRGDNYCGVRAVIFQILAQGLPVPCGADTFKCLSYAFNKEGCKWLQNWTFANRLPYEGSNVLHGMENCLRSLDNVASLLSSSKDRGETLAAILNSDISLDLHVVEAVKLHMLVRARELHQASTNGADIPLFAILMFARDTSETPRDFMNNHLLEVGNSGGLEQVEMFLLGYTFSVTLRVVRPSAYGTEDFICFYPDWNVGVWPEVVLIAEDDRHYNILVN